MVENLWNAEEASQQQTAVSSLRYRSNLLGSDRSVCNWGGGNTSVKSIEVDFKGQEIEVMWVKGSGSDLATMEEKHFTALKLEDVTPLIEREDMSDEEMVKYLGQCMIDSSHPRASIETLLHAFLPYKHVDHTHPDAIISICCAPNGREIADEVYGNRYVWVPYIRPGFLLSKMIAEGEKANPHAELVLMEKHGLVVWGETAEESYTKTIEIINEAQAYIDQSLSVVEPFGGVQYTTLEEEQRHAMFAKVLPVVRGEVSEHEGMIATFDDSEAVLEFVNSVRAETISQVGAACPDHLVHTKRVPLYVKWNPVEQGEEELVLALQQEIAVYKEQYKDYFKQYANVDDKMFSPAPRVILIPGLGLIAIGKDIGNANVSRNLYHRAISVMKGSDAIGGFQSLNAEESFAIEYWPLELYKLSLAPKEAEFSRKVCFVTGGAGGIGSETCRLFASQGGHVVLADLNFEGANKVAEEINSLYGAGRALAVKMDVTVEAEIQEAFKQATLAYGGVDVLVNNAGLATSSPFEETTLSEWNLNMNVL